MFHFRNEITLKGHGTSLHNHPVFLRTHSGDTSYYNMDQESVPPMSSYMATTQLVHNGQSFNLVQIWSFLRFCLVTQVLQNIGQNGRTSRDL